MVINFWNKKISNKGIISKKNDNEEISIKDSGKSQNLTELLFNILNTLLSTFKSIEKITSKKLVAGDMLAFLLK